MEQHPVLGLGTGGSKQAVSGQFFTGRGLHDTFLSVVVELGVIGLVLFLLLMLAGMYRALTRLPPLETRLAWVLAIVFLISLVPRHGDYMKSTYALLTLFALMGTVLPPREATSGSAPQGATTRGSSRPAY
jgi:O-antigen ligase